MAANRNKWDLQLTINIRLVVYFVGILYTRQAMYV